MIAERNSKERLLDHLQQLGLSHQEAVVYSTLVSLGPSPARDLSHAASLAREHCYEVLRKLEAKGLVKVELADRSMYTAVEPRATVAFFISSLDSRFTALRDTAYETGALLETLSGKIPRSHEERMRPAPQVQLLFGQRVTLEFERQLEACKDEYMGIISPWTLVVPGGLRTLEFLEKTARRGIKVRLVTSVLPEYGNGLECLKRFSGDFKIRKNSLAESGLRFALFDRARAMQPMHGPAVVDEKREVIYTENPTVVDSLAVYFEFLWRNSSPLYPDVVRATRMGVRK